MKKPTFLAAQLAVAGVLFIGLALTLSLFFFGLRNHLYFPDEFTPLLFSTAKVFAPHIALLVAVLLAGGRSTRRRSVAVPALVVAVSALSIWIAVIAGTVWMFVTDAAGGDTTADMLRFLEQYPEQYGFLVTGIMGFFFVSEAAKTET